MPWFKVDDSFESHPKVKAIPRARRVKAIGLWTLAGSWSARQLTDGFVPSYMLDELAATKTEANTLVEVGLWSPVDGGYLFKDWHDWQPTKAKVEAEREAAKERMRVARERKKGTRSGDVRANTSATPPNGSGEVRSTPRSVTPTRPDPTRPDQEDNNVPEADASDAPKSLALIERQDVEQVCEHLAAAVEANGSKRPTITAKWRTAARLMLDKDGRGIEEIHGAIDWCQRDEFWRANVMSLPTLREKFDQLRLQAQRAPKGIASRADEWKSMQERQMARAIEREREMGIR